MYRRFLRPGWIAGHLIVVLAVLVCLRLGWWQWDRTHDADGTVQNLGYAVLWPIFGAAFIYMWIRFLQLEVVKDAEDDAELTDLAAGDYEPGRDLHNADSVDPAGTVSTESTQQVPASATDRRAREDRSSENSTDEGDLPGRSGPATPRSAPRNTPSRGFTIAVSTVGADSDEQDPELAAYNRALAALAEKDRRRAH